MALKKWKETSEGIEAAKFTFQHHDQKWKNERRYVVVRQMINRRPKVIHSLNRNILNAKGPFEQFTTLRSKYFIIPAVLEGEGVIQCFVFRFVLLSFIEFAAMVTQNRRPQEVGAFDQLFNSSVTFQTSGDNQWRTVPG
ncbi:MAG: hypothetical protein V2A69_16480 [Pseudomonadota bacterium]